MSIDRDSAKKLKMPPTDGTNNHLRYSPRFQKTEKRIPYENMRFKSSVRKMNRSNSEFDPKFLSLKTEARVLLPDYRRD